MTTAREWRKHGGRRLGPLPARLDRSEGGRHLWRSLGEQAERPEFRRRLEAEFPAVAPLLTEASRRDVLRIMSASLILAGLAGCGDPAPDERAVPYVEAPESLVAGVPLFYATAFPLAGYAVPVLVETHMARPIKVEGNPEHPLTRGGTDPLVPAAVLDVYDRTGPRS